MPSLRLDPLDQHAAENVATSCRRRPPATPAAARSPAKRAVGLAAVSVASRSMPANGGRPPPPSAARARRTDRRCGPSMQLQVSAAACGRAPASPRSRPSAPRRAVRPVPFQHREFGMMQRPALAVAEHTGELKIRARRPPAASCRRIPATCADKARGRRRASTSSVAKACRWVSLPGETCRAGVSTSTKSALPE